MKTPICELCAQTGTLCQGCKSKLKSGKINLTEVQIAKLLYQINEEYNISGASFENAIDLENIVVILTAGEPGLLIGKGGKVVSELSRALGKKVRIAEYTGDMKKTVADILLPVKLLGINTMYSKGGEYYKIKIPKPQFMQLPLDLLSLEKVLKSLLKNDVKISLE